MKLNLEEMKPKSLFYNSHIKPLSWTVKDGKLTPRGLLIDFGATLRVTIDSRVFWFRFFGYGIHFKDLKTWPDWDNQPKLQRRRVKLGRLAIRLLVPGDQ